MFSDSMILDQINRGRISIKGGPPLYTDKLQRWLTDVLQPVSYELTLGDSFFDPDTRARFSGVLSYFLEPGEFILASTAETVSLSPEIVATVHGKSSLGRQGLMVHVTAGLIDPGFSGQITLELYNVGQSSVSLEPGMRICQLTFDAVIGKLIRQYGDPGLGSHYQNQMGATPPA